MNELLPFAGFNLKWAELYEAQQFDNAFELTTRHKDAFPSHKSFVLYLHLCMVVRVGKHDLALAQLEEALNTGSWFSEELLRQSPSFAPLQDMPAFDPLVQRSAKLAEAELATPPPPVIVKPEGDGPYPLLIGLHGSPSNGQNALGIWGGLEKKGWLLAFPSSNQRAMHNLGDWADQDAAAQAIKDLYAMLCKDYKVDLNRVVIAGYSGGGFLATWLALSNAFKMRGFLGVGPYLPQEALDEWGELIETASKELRGVILSGDKDDSVPRDTFAPFAESLNAQGITCKVEEVSGSTHDIDDNYRALFPAALDYLVR